MKATLNEIKEITQEINNFYGFEKFGVKERNSYIYIDDLKTGSCLTPDHATTKKEIYLCLKSYKKGLYDSLNTYERVFMVTDSRGNMNICNIGRLNTICEDLNEGYFNIFEIWNNTPKKVTKKGLKQLFESARIEQKFIY